jgi:hypothetical protein
MTTAESATDKMTTAESATDKMTTAESAYDFESAGHFFADHEQRQAFEKLATFVENTCDMGRQNLCVLDFFHFIKDAGNSIVQDGFFQAGRFSPAMARFKRIKYQGYDPYTIYIIIKYIGLPDMSKKLLDTFFDRNIFSPATMLQIYNDEFIQVFFGVDSRININDIVESLDLQNIRFEAQYLIYEYADTIIRYLSKYNVIRLRVKFTYFVTQNIIFDKTNFTNDFYMRYNFALSIAAIYKIDVFGVIIEWPSSCSVIREKLVEFIIDSSVQTKIRKTFLDWYSDTERKWTFCNYAKKLDAGILSDFLVPYNQSKPFCDATNLFINPEVDKANLYLYFIEIFDSVTSAMDKQPHYLEGQDAEFARVLFTLRKMVPYTKFKLWEYKSSIHLLEKE